MVKGERRKETGGEQEERKETRGQDDTLSVYYSQDSQQNMDPSEACLVCDFL